MIKSSSAADRLAPPSSMGSAKHLQYAQDSLCSHGLASTKNQTQGCLTHTTQVPSQDRFTSWGWPWNLGSTSSLTYRPMASAASGAKPFCSTISRRTSPQGSLSSLSIALQVTRCASHAPILTAPSFSVLLSNKILLQQCFVTQISNAVLCVTSAG